jgi:hypothetical protein
MTRKFTIGREKSCDIPIADESVSRVHAEVWLSDDGCLMMADNGSSNGTTVLRNGLSFPLRQDVMLPTDQVRFGNVTLGVSDVVEAIESRNPGALLPGGGFAPPPPPPPALSAPPPPAGMVPALPMAPPPVQVRPGQLLRCSCGAIKAFGKACPECNQ